jgi:hypothetical protein
LTITGLAVALEETLVAERHRAAVAGGGAGLGAVVHQAHFQRGGAAQDVLGLGVSCTPGKLHHDTVYALLLDHRLGHTQFVDHGCAGSPCSA